MVEFKSSIGKTQGPSQGVRHFTVPDASAQPRTQSFAGTQNVAPDFDPDIHESGADYQARIERELGQQAPASFSTKDHSAEEVMQYRQRMINERTANVQQTFNSDKRKLSVLLNIGRMYDSVRVKLGEELIEFGLQTLKSKERQHVMRAWDAVNKLKSYDALYDLRNVSLSYAINTVDGIPLDNILGFNSQMSDEDRYLIREAFVRDLDDNLILFLYKKFEELDTASKTHFNLGTEDGVKGVADAVKKS